MSQIIEKRIKFAANQHEIETLLNDGERVACQFEGEVSATITKPVGDGNKLAIYTIKPLAVRIKGIDPQYETPTQDAKPKEKSKAKELRDLIYVLYDQQFKHKYKDSNKYYEMYMDVIIEKVREKII